jgi:hypothetical protein
MIILMQGASNESFNFISRINEIDQMLITDEQENVEVEVTIKELQISDYTNTIVANFNLKENHFYTLKLKYSGNVVYQDKIFCTDQPINTFSVNNGQYIVNTTTNEFIIYE